MSYRYFFEESLNLDDPRKDNIKRLILPLGYGNPDGGYLYGDEMESEMRGNE